MDYRTAPSARHAGQTPAARKTSQQQRAASSHNNKNNNDAPGFLNFDSDRSTTLDSLKDLMAFSQRPPRARQDDIQHAAKKARAAHQMPPHFSGPPSSTGSHGTITTDSIFLDNGDNRNNNLTGDSDTSSTFSAGPDAESTRASMHYQRGSHRVQRTTGRFDKNARDDNNNKSSKKATTDLLSGIVNTSALFRTFKEWKPEDVTDPSVFDDENDDNDDEHDEDAPSTTNFGVVNKLSRYDQENCGPVPSSPAPAAAATAAAATASRPKSPAAETAARRNHRHVLQPTVQNESDLSVVMMASAQKPAKPTTQPSPLRKASSAAPAPTPILKRPATGGSMRAPENARRQRVSVVEEPPSLDDLTSPETSAGSREDIDLGVRTVAAPVPSPEPMPGPRPTTMARTENMMDGATNQSFIVPSKSFPLLHNLVTGTLRFTPGTYCYGNTADAQRKYQLPAGTVPGDEKEIFVDIENIRDEVRRLQEHDEMLQNEIVQGEMKYKALLDRFYGLSHKADDAMARDFDGPLKESQEENHLLHNKIQELEIDLDVIHMKFEEQVLAASEAEAERDAALARSSAATEQAKQLSADLEATREKLAAAAAVASRQRANQEAQRRIQQLETMVTERERVIKALKDERAAAASSHREECKLFRERITRLEAEKTMLSSDHAKCGDERYALNTAKEALALKNTALKHKVQQVRQQGKAREASTYSIVERQRVQITKLQTLLREKEKSVLQLDETFRKLRASWASSKDDETVMRMNEVLEQLPEGHVGALDADPTEDFDVDTRDFEFGGEEEEKGDPANAADDEGDQDSDGESVDENMTSAFIIPDIDLEAEEEGEEEDEEEDHDEQAEEEARSIAARNAAAAAAATTPTTPTKTARQKSVSFQATTTATATTTTATAASPSVCKHNRVNCVICYQKAGPAGENEKVTVAVPRPIAVGASSSSSASTQHQQDSAAIKSTAKDMDPGSALAYVMKLLDDERRHLWMQIQSMRKTGEAEEALNEKRRPRRALREAEELWNAYVLKVEQLNRLDHVLEGQRAAGQDMTREEIDVTITRILEA